ncbi:hypothetical protein [Streptomyces sp. NPDC054849]
MSGVAGLLIQTISQRYLHGYRGWTKIRRRGIAETTVGAIAGTLTCPGLLVLGRHDQEGWLRAVGRTVLEHRWPQSPGATATAGRSRGASAWLIAAARRPTSSASSGKSAASSP